MLSKFIGDAEVSDYFFNAVEFSFALLVENAKKEREMSVEGYYSQRLIIFTKWESANVASEIAYFIYKNMNEFLSIYDGVGFSRNGGKEPGELLSYTALMFMSLVATRPGGETGQNFEVKAVIPVGSDEPKSLQFCKDWGKKVSVFF